MTNKRSTQIDNNRKFQKILNDTRFMKNLAEHLKKMGLDKEQEKEEDNKK